MAVTADVKGTAILRNKVADYLNTEPGEESPAYHLMNVFETIDENPNAQVVEKHYTSDKAATKLTSGYAPQFPITGDQYLDNDVSEFIRDIAEEQQIGVETDFIRVRLYQPIASKENTFYARKFRVSVEVSSITGAGGEIISQEGNLNQIGDVVIGEFNTQTKTFTEAAAAPASAEPSGT